MKTYSIEKTIYIEATPEFVFDKLTCSSDIVRYFPLREVISDWKEGSEVLYKGELDGRGFTDFGRIERLNRPNEYHYVYWSDNHGTARVAENYLSIRYRLTSEGRGTQLMLKQENLQSEEMYQLMETVVWAGLLSSMKSFIENSFQELDA